MNIESSFTSITPLRVHGRVRVVFPHPGSPSSPRTVPSDEISRGHPGCFGSAYRPAKYVVVVVSLASALAAKNPGTCARALEHAIAIAAIAAHAARVVVVAARPSSSPSSSRRRARAVVLSARRARVARALERADVAFIDVVVVAAVAAIAVGVEASRRAARASPRRARGRARYEIPYCAWRVYAFRTWASRRLVYALAFASDRIKSVGRRRLGVDADARVPTAHTRARATDRRARRKRRRCRR